MGVPCLAFFVFFCFLRDRFFLFVLSCGTTLVPTSNILLFTYQKIKNRHLIFYSNSFLQLSYAIYNTLNMNIKRITLLLKISEGIIINKISKVKYNNLVI